MTRPLTDGTENNAIPTDKGRYDGITSFIYIGPSLPGAMLKENAVLSGTFTEIIEYLKDAVEKYPSIEKLLVPISQLAEAKEKLSKPGNIFNKRYTDLVHLFKSQKRKGE